MTAASAPPDSVSTAAGLIDTHCHLDDAQFGAEAPRVIQRARDAGVTQMVCVGTDYDSTRACFELASRYPFIYATVGLHPHFADRTSSDDAFAPFEAIASHPRVVGIGETGLDYFKKFSRPERQESLFRRHIRLALSVGKPLVIHCRNAYDHFFKILSSSSSSSPQVRPPIQGVLHCFSGSREDARRALDLGFFISIAGPVTYPNASNLAEIARFVPLDRLVVETDSPYLAPQAHRGRRNEPAFVVHVAEKIAELKGVPFDEICARTTANAHALFGIGTR